MKHQNVLWTALLFIGLAALAGCGVRTDCPTAQEFIKSYSQAYRNGDAKAIIKMRAGIGLLEKLGIDPALREQIADYTLEKEQQDLEESLERDDLWARAWKDTEYKSQKDHGDHIHVGVLVNGIPSAVVLVREGEFLRIHPRPSWFD
ncbi:MAG: hypothetical protein RDU76_01510 [Candidatus Edwardsbacteria bacterium]|nr:hypothetical protein [Candidatus Edwardsbacteria bacterium]